MEEPWSHIIVKYYINVGLNVLITPTIHPQLQIPSLNLPTLHCLSCLLFQIALQEYMFFTTVDSEYMYITSTQLKEAIIKC